MKKKITKLTLSVETLRNLSEPTLQQVAGQATGACSAGPKCSIGTYICSGCRPCL